MRNLYVTSLGAWRLIWHNFLRSLPTGSENPQETDYAVFSSLGDAVFG